MAMLHIRVPVELVERIKIIAEAEKRSVTRTVELALEDYAAIMERRLEREGKSAA
jgi:predicted transcriptional regulator